MKQSKVKVKRYRRRGPQRRGDNQYVQAQQIWLILTAHVMAWQRPPTGLRPHRRSDKLITYSELAERMGMKKGAAQNVGRPVGIVGKYCLLNELPMLNTIVIKGEKRKPGHRVLVRPGKTLLEEQREVVKEDWFAYRVPKAGAFRKAHFRKAHK